MGRTAKEIFEQLDSVKKQALPADVIALIREVTTRNDTRSTSARLSAPRMVQILREDFGIKIGRDRLDRICREDLGRQGWGRA